MVRRRAPRRQPPPQKRRKKKKNQAPPKPSPIKSTTAHFLMSLPPTDIDIDGETFGLVDSAELDSWEVFAEASDEWPAMLIDEDDRDRFVAMWETKRFPIEMVDDIVAGALGEIIGNNWGSCRAVVAFAFETDLAPRVAVGLSRARIEPFALPPHLLPIVLYGLIVEWAPQEAKTKLDKAIREFADTITVRAERDEMQTKLDEFDDFIQELGVDLTTGGDEEE